MRRALPVLLATVAAMALLAGFHTTPARTQPVAATVALPDSTTTAPPAAPPASGAPPDETTSTAPAETTSTAPAERSVDGPTVFSRFGDVQVRVILQGTRIVDVQSLQLPFDRPRSQSISDQAGPWLHDEAIQAQSANIDTIGGATYTSDGYRQSLQAALDQAGIS